MFCHNCGTKNKPDTKFCANCGAELRPVVKTPVVEGGNEVQNKVQNKTQNEVQPQSRTVKKKSKSLWWLWIVLILAVAGAGGYYVYTNYFQTSIPSNSKDSAKTKSSTSKSSASKAASSSSKPKKTALNFPKSTVQGTIDDAFGDISGTTSVYVSPADGDEKVVSKNGAQRSASSIKLFIMVVAFQQVKDGKLSLDDEYRLRDSDKVGGTGEVREMSDGTELTYQELLEYMIENSDNTAANIVIEKLGGVDKVNDQIQKLGVSDTKLERKMLDNDALDAGKDNYTSVEDMGTILKKIYNHRMVSSTEDDAMLSILKDNENHTKLSHDLPDEATIYNKTGEYDTPYGIENDASIFENDKGALIVVVMSENGDRDEQVQQMNSFGEALYEGILE
jgi:beta-lactamase class A